MFWLGLLIVSIVLAVYGISNICKNEWIFGLGFAGSIIGAIASITILLSSFTIYPDICAEREKMTVLQQEINTIKNARYEEVNGGSVIGGSLDNLKQSTNFSDYLVDYVRAKAEFNRRLTKVKISLTISAYWWFGQNMFIDERVKDIELLK